MSVVVEPLETSISLGQMEAIEDPRRQARQFEAYVDTLLNHVEGLSVEAANAGRDQTFDLVAWNAAAALELRVLGTPLFVECKWSQKPIDAGTVKRFAARLAERGLNAGLLVSNQPAGTRLDPALLAAQAAGRRIILLDRDDLSRIENGEPLARRVGERLKSLLLS